MKFTKYDFVNFCWLISFCVDMYYENRQNSFIIAEQMFSSSSVKEVIETGTINSMLFLGQNLKGFLMFKYILLTVLLIDNDV